MIILRPNRSRDSLASCPKVKPAFHSRGGRDHSSDLFDSNLGGRDWEKKKKTIETNDSRL